MTSVESSTADAITAEPRAAYVHVPFCKHRCGYCDFTLMAGRDDLIPAYLAAMRGQLETLGRPREVETLFVGGGTPTHLPDDHLQAFLSLLRQWFTLSADAEFSVEANPYGLTDRKLAILVEAGVNRISLGVQSFDAGALAVLERDHTPPQALDAVTRSVAFIPNTAVDLIFGVPGQSLDVWRHSLFTAIELGVTHVSTYGLTFEKGTTFWSRRLRGELRPTSDEVERDMYAAGMDTLSAEGFEQYELSNHARPGFACRHNQVYWAGQPYFGFGPGAASYLNGERAVNHRSPITWLRRIERQEDPIAEREQLSPEDRARELIVLGLRRTTGVSRTEFQAATAFALDELVGDAIAKNIRRGWLMDSTDRIALTREGRFVADTVAGDFL